MSDARDRIAEVLAFGGPKYARHFDGRAKRDLPKVKSGSELAREWGDLAWTATGIPMAQEGIADIGKGTLPGALSGAGKLAGAGIGYVPLAGPAARGIMTAASKAPVATAAGAGGAVALVPGEADSQVTRRTQNRIAEQDAAARRRTEEEERNKESARKDEAERARIARANRASDAAEKDRLAEVERNKTFAQKYPEWADALPGIGVGIAAGVPFAGKALSQRVRNAPVRQWDAALKGADEAATAGKVAPLNNNLAKLDQFNRAMPDGTLPAQTSWMPTASAAGFGAAAGMEARAFPDQWNAYNLPPSNPERDASMARMTDLSQLWKYGALGAASGMGGYKAGSWLVPDKTGPIQASQGMVARYGAGTGDDAATALSRDAFRQQEINGIRQASPAVPQLSPPPQPAALSHGQPLQPAALQPGPAATPAPIPAPQPQISAASSPPALPPPPTDWARHWSDPARATVLEHLNMGGNLISGRGGLTSAELVNSIAARTAGMGAPPSEATARAYLGKLRTKIGQTPTVNVAEQQFAGDPNRLIFGIGGAAAGAGVLGMPGDATANSAIGGNNAEQPGNGNGNANSAIGGMTNQFYGSSIDPRDLIALQMAMQR